MMPNVVRGDRMSGLMTYLTGPGRSNEHTEPHLVAGDPALMAWHDDAELGRDAALSIARHLDKPRAVFGVEVPGGHVWHCSLSLRADEGQLADEQWGAIANDFIAAMEFDDNEGTKAPCRWVAVRHGVSSNGNDHIHIAVNLVREDGTKASIHNDFHRAQVAARALEVKYGLEQLESVRAERSTRGYDPAEREAQARSRARAKYERTRPQLGDDALRWEHLTGPDRQARISAELRTDQPRYLLALKVRGCAGASRSEAEFVRRMRREGLLVRPRYADGRTDVVTGYSVAERPTAGERPIWYGGGHLGRDLTLPRLRDGWEDTPQGATAAVAEWNAAKRGRRVVAPGRERLEPTNDQALRHSERLARTVDELARVPLDDRETWATVARQTAGALAAWSNAVEETPGDIAAAAEALSRSAQTYRRTPPPAKAGTIAISGAALFLASAVRGGQGTVGEAALVREMLTLTVAVMKVAEAARQDRYARTALADARDRLERVHAALPTPPARSVGQAAVVEEQGSVATEAPALDAETRAMLDRLNAGRSGTPGSPVPRELRPDDSPARRPAPRPGRDGTER
ncbi:relaxase/mobilization nuclease domain-containing protein [Leifsonia sp. 71-9]|uniref:relaxase/mobilization nuclease domain-containing protein n=1 Tax=Leifsonia sp. 71-9 TaxID=1895934 RepID=UPI0009274520|nr:relaxase/mobilization nuclease domain-containing protein [Leifsonia sp. 71-9]OJX77816.1 MAG: relaxase [Leifsonia sp. 71-9]